jgi:membrane protease YdiL (CAAX protease family)
MPPSQEDFLLSTFILGLAGARLATWWTLVARMRRGPILVYVPRRPVPWNVLPTVLPVVFVMIAVLSALVAGGRGEQGGGDEVVAAREEASQIAATITEECLIVGLLVAAVVVIYGATRVDLGLPGNAGELVHDVKIGVIAWLAALVPVYGTQMLLVLTFGEPSQHPLIQMVSKDPSGMIFLAAFVAAVIVAPICEEIMFRLLLQGWLEKWEDRRLGWRVDAISAAMEVYRATGDEKTSGDIVSRGYVHTQEPPIHGLFGLPHGWLPILVSSVLFALAHFGFGPDPVPLFLLALVLGYTYQRTHRIVPCIVTHALFNSLTLLALWRMLWSGTPVGP